MASFNKITLVGYLGRDPEMHFTPQGTAVCTFSVATTEKRKGPNDEHRDITTWFSVSAFGRQAENAHQYLTKGQQVYVEGRLWLEEWTDREGCKRTSAKVAATDVRYLGKVGGSEQQSPQRVATAAQKPVSDDEDESDIPF